MFSAVLGLFSQDLAVDPGTSNTRVWLRGTGVVRTEPTVVSVHTGGAGKRSVLATGEDALPMLGRTPSDIEAVQPVRGGRLADYEVAEAFLLHLMRSIHGRNGLMRPRMVLTIPHDASAMEVRALRDSCEAAGARETLLVPRPVAAAIGVGLPVDEPAGSMVVDVGGGCTEVSVLSMGGVVASTTVEGGGEGMDASIMRHLERTHALAVGRPTAERLKIRLGTACGTPGTQPVVATAKGRCLRHGIPRAVRVNTDEVCVALQDDVRAIATAMRELLDRVPPEIASDIVDRGVVLVGGGSGLRRLDAVVRHLTGLPVVVADDPETAVIRGAGQVLDELDLQQAIAC